MCSVLATFFFVGELIDKLLACAKTVEELLDSDYLTFRYRPQNNPTSTIIAEFLLSADFQGNDVYIFLAIKENHEKYFFSHLPPRNIGNHVNRLKAQLLFVSNIFLGKEELLACAVGVFFSEFGD